jgi:hypothetical protein
MKKNNSKIILKKKLYKFDYNVLYLFKKKIFEKKNILNKKKYIELLCFFKIFFLFSIQNVDYYFDFKMRQYHLLRNF